MHAFLFDLDGTLLDTAADMTLALNRLLEKQSKETLPVSAVRPQVSGGSPALLKLAFGIEKSSPDYESLRERFLNLYKEKLRVNTDLFEGFEEVLFTLEKQTIPWGIVTNKPRFLTEPLLDLCELTSRYGALVCGDTLPERKPHPAPIQYACGRLNALPHKTIYVGDHLNDIKAGNAAGALTIAALYGYIPENENPMDWGAGGVIQNPIDLLKWV